jgi:hypothetical protein
VTVREAAPDDAAALAAAIDAHYAGHDFARRWDEARLAEWLAASPLPGPVNHCLVVSDPSGRLLAGTGNGHLSGTTSWPAGPYWRPERTDVMRCVLKPNQCIRPT